MKVAVYARVSKTDLNLQNQLRPMTKRAQAEGWDYDIFEEKETTRKTRPVKEEVLGKLRRREYRGLLVYALDRWARSVGEFALELEEFKDRKIALYSIREGFSFDTAMGQAMANMAMTFAQLERDLIKERTLEGLKTARASGKILGRHPRGCGCGYVSESGRMRHDGPVKPLRDEEGRLIGWKAPDGQRVRSKCVQGRRSA